MGAPMYGWMLLACGTHHEQVSSARLAAAALRRRYAAGEISREDYLQAKVELED